MSDLFRKDARKTLAVFLLAIVCATVPQQVAGQSSEQRRRSLKRERDIQTAYGAFRYIPRSENGRTVGFETNDTAAPVLFAAGGDGRTHKISFALPETRLINLVDISASPEGHIAVVGGAYSNDGKGMTFLARIEAGGERQVVTNTWPYCPVTVSFAPDGTLWTIGHLKDEANTKVTAYHVLRRFDLSGRMVGSTVVAGKVQILDATSFLRMSRDRVGWFTRENEYIEFRLDGSESARYAGPVAAIDDARVDGLAISDHNDVFVSLWKKNQREYLFLDRTNRTWVPASVSETVKGVIYGFDGTTLVTNGGWGRLRLFALK